MDEYKIVFAGNMGAGKTTAISLLSDIDIVSTDVLNTDDNHQKATTTVAIDYGYVDLSDSLRLVLYGTPGQKRFSFMWKIIAQGALGVIVLVDSTDANALTDLQSYIDFYLAEGVKDIVIGITHSDREGALAFDHFIQVMQKSSQQALPVFLCDARERADIMFLLEVLVASIEARL